jgi:hypothetical protein
VVLNVLADRVKMIRALALTAYVLLRALVAALRAASSAARLTVPVCPVTACRAASSAARLTVPACPVAALRAAAFSARPFDFSSATFSSVISAARAAPRISF